MDRKTGLADLEEELEKEGFPSGILKPEGDLLILQLSEDQRTRLLADPGLRQRLVGCAKNLGFSRVTLELSPLGEGGMLGET